ncbi:hydantoinase/oxoprolinase family protein [Chloroflexota bacterium]
MNQDNYILGIDTGGTFTDVVVMSQSGETWIDKAPTTPRDFSSGVMEAIGTLSRAMGLSVEELLSQCKAVKHGTTVATNALINRDGSKVGLITTKGFEDNTLIMRAIGRVAGLSEEEIKHQSTAVKPIPLVPRGLIKGVTERVDAAGNVVIPMNLEEAKEAIRSLVEDEKVEAIALNFLFGFVNPVHEKKIGELVHEMYPNHNILMSMASELVPVVREYARSNTVIINAFLDAVVRRYIGGLRTKLHAAGYRHPLMIMQASGGIAPEQAVSTISMLQSGPAGGIIGSKYMADVLGHDMVITTDMGGTSFDVGLITHGFWHYSRAPIVERFHVTWPMIDVESVGAGGGTIARVEPVTKALVVGPRSAGADPGPVCYGLGNTEPTVTDADVVLGYLDPDYFLDGRMKLDKSKAEQAIREKIAEPLSMDVVQAAAGIFDIVNAHMADLIRKKVVRTGFAPEEHIIYAFGGAGPAHAAAYASELGVKKLYVFPSSAVFSAFGIAAADIVHTYMTSYRYAMPVDPQKLNKSLSDIEERLYDTLRREGFRRKDIEFRRTLYMRYTRQVNELEVKVPTKRYNQEDIYKIAEEFQKRYEEIYGEGSAYPGAGTEVISFSVDAVANTPKPVISAHKEVGLDPSKAIKGTRKVYFTGGVNAFLDTKIYEYAMLEPGNILDGPSIIETPVTTIVVPPLRCGRVDSYCNIEINL